MTRTFGWIAAVLALAAVVFAGFQWWQKSRVASDAPQPPVAEAPAAAPTTPAPPGIEYPIERAQQGAATVPIESALDASDAALSQSLASVFAGGKLPEFVIPQSLIRNIVATIDNLPREKVAYRLMPVRPVRGPFVISSNGDSMAIAEENAARYRPIVALVEAMDVKQLVGVYKRFYPLFQQAYVELGYPDGYFNDRLVVVIDHLLATPYVKTPVALVQPKVSYRFADPELEALSAGQKAMIRIGSENAAKLKLQLREIRSEITGSSTAR